MLLHMKHRTTLLVDRELFQRAKRKAAEKGVPLSLLFENSLRLALESPNPKNTGYRFQWETTKAVLRADVDFSDRESLYEKMEGSE